MFGEIAGLEVEIDHAAEQRFLAIAYHRIGGMRQDGGGAGPSRSADERHAPAQRNVGSFR